MTVAVRTRNSLLLIAAAVACGGCRGGPRSPFPQDFLDDDAPCRPPRPAIGVPDIGIDPVQKPPQVIDNPISFQVDLKNAESVTLLTAYALLEVKPAGATNYEEAAAFPLKTCTLDSLNAGRAAHVPVCDPRIPVPIGSDFRLTLTVTYKRRSLRGSFDSCVPPICGVVQKKTLVTSDHACRCP